MTTPDVGQTIRFPSTSLLTIDSEDRWADYNQARAQQAGPFLDPFNFRLQGNQVLSTGFFTRLGVSEVVMPWCPNINPKTNKIIINWDVSGSPTVLNQTITLLGGFYNPQLLAATMQTQVRALTGNPLPGFTMTFGGLDYPSFAYSSNVAGTNISFSPVPYQSATYPYPATTKQLFDVLGFTNANNPLDASGNPLPIPGTVQPSGVSFYRGLFTLCQAIRYVDIVCPRLVAYQGLFDGSSQGNARDSLCRVYLGGFVSQLATVDDNFSPIGTLPVVVYRNFTNPKQIQWIAKQNISANLEFQVYGDDGQLFSSNFKEGVGTQENWSMTLLLSEN
jgi:hypothetical protein